MPNTKSAIKALRQSAKRREKNLVVANSYKRTVKEFRRLAKDGKKKEAAEYYAKVQKRLDKAAKTGVIKKNKASRLKSNAAKYMARASQ
jgi:small subunit ribosomal protein S20